MSGNVFRLGMNVPEGSETAQPAIRSSTSASTSKLAWTSEDVVGLFEHVDQPQQPGCVGLVDRHPDLGPLNHVGGFELDPRRR